MKIAEPDLESFATCSECSLRENAHYVLEKWLETFVLRTRSSLLFLGVLQCKLL